METLQELRDECKKAGVKYTPADTKSKLSTKLKNHKMAEETKSGNITPEQIKEWKRKHGKVHKISVKVSEEDTAVGYLKKPNRNHKATALSMYAKDKILECGEFLRNNCWLGGDERLLNDDDIADTAAVQASGIIKFLESELGEA